MKNYLEFMSYSNIVVEGKIESCLPAARRGMTEIIINRDYPTDDKAEYLQKEVLRRIEKGNFLMAVNWSFKREFSFKKERFARIYRFYVIETPVAGTSRRGKSLKEREINMNSLNAALKRESSFLKDNWIETTANDIERICVENGINEKVDFSTELAIHTFNNKHCSGKTDSLFYAIRCAFAHGSFDIHTFKNDTYYILENRNGNTLKARMILKESTLLKWIDVVESMPKAQKSKRRN